jgi:hypothetical protein
MQEGDSKLELTRKPERHWRAGRNSNFETMSNDQNSPSDGSRVSNDRNESTEFFIVGAKDAVLNIRKFEFQICPSTLLRMVSGSNHFGFRASGFEFMVV